jgi:hypothetical protein
MVMKSGWSLTEKGRMRDAVQFQEPEEKSGVLIPLGSNKNKIDK